MKITKKQLKYLINKAVNESTKIGGKSNFNIEERLDDNHILNALISKDRNLLKNIGFVEPAVFDQDPEHFIPLLDWYASFLNCHRDDILVAGRFTSSLGFSEPPATKITKDRIKLYKHVLGMIQKDKTANRTVLGKAQEAGVFPPNIATPYPDHENVLVELENGSIRLIQSLHGLSIRYGIFPLIIVCAPENKKTEYYI